MIGYGNRLPARATLDQAVILATEQAQRQRRRQRVTLCSCGSGRHFTVEPTNEPAPTPRPEFIEACS